jgi:hypothetical protein
VKHSRSSSTKPNLNYAGLTRALRSLGYAESRDAAHVVFSHPKAHVSLILPPRRQTERVDSTRMAGVYQLVASGGVVSREDLDAAIAANGAVD